MPRNVYSEINFHLVWHTKESRAFIKPQSERMIYDRIRKRAYGVDGAFVHQIGGTTNHVHMVITVPPTLYVPTWIGKVKGGSSHDINEDPAMGGLFEWQTGYGVVCFGTKDLPWVIRYVKDQKQHHARGTWQDRLERTTRPDEEGSSR